jgi:hypothetical protein
MRNIVLAAIAAILLGSAAMATPAEARCFWNGFAWECYHPHPWWWYHRHHHWHHWHHHWH